MITKQGMFAWMLACGFISAGVSIEMVRISVFFCGIGIAGVIGLMLLYLEGGFEQSDTPFQDIDKKRRGY